MPILYTDLMFFSGIMFNLLVFTFSCKNLRLGVVLKV